MVATYCQHQQTTAIPGHLHSTAPNTGSALQRGRNEDQQQRNTISTDRFLSKYLKSRAHEESPVEIQSGLFWAIKVI